MQTTEKEHDDADDVVHEAEAKQTVKVANAAAGEYASVPGEGSDDMDLLELSEIAGNGKAANGTKSLTNGAKKSVQQGRTAIV